MQATLTFDLNDIDDKMAHLRCAKATDMAIALWEIRTNLRKRCERMVVENDADVKEIDAIYKGMQIVLDQIGDIFNDNDINVDELIN
jgi:molecular chaperone GrpE (heat shock protein)